MENEKVFAIYCIANTVKNIIQKYEALLEIN